MLFLIILTSLKFLYIIPQVAGVCQVTFGGKEGFLVVLNCKKVDKYCCFVVKLLTDDVFVLK